MELRRLKGPFEPHVQRAIEAFDCGNSEVNGFLRHYAEPIVDHRLGTVLVLVEDGEILSFVSLSFASVSLTNAEKGVFRAVTTAYGAVRIGSIGTATRHQGRSCGSALLQATVARARRVSETVGLRYLVADANQERVSWYREHGWVANRSRKEQDRLAGRALTSMRFDLGSSTR